MSFFSFCRNTCLAKEQDSELVLGKPKNKLKKNTKKIEKEELTFNIKPIVIDSYNNDIQINDQFKNNKNIFKKESNFII